MRILVLEHEPSSSRGGQEHSLVDECLGLRALGHQVTLAYETPGDLLERYRAAGVDTLRVPTLWLDKSAGLRGALALARAAWLGVRARPDAVIVNQYLDTLLGAAIARARRVPLVCHLRLFPPDIFSRQWRLGLREVTRFIAVSGAVKSAWIDRGCDPDSVGVVHDGIDLDRFRILPSEERLRVRRELGTTDDAHVLLFAGRIDPQKHLEAMLDTFARLVARVPSARLWIAGRPVVHRSALDGKLAKA